MPFIRKVRVFFKTRLIFPRINDPIVVVQNNGKEMYKKVCCTCKVAFLLIRPIVVFHRSPALPSPLNITRFYILFEQTLNIIESFAFSPG